MTATRRVASMCVCVRKKMTQWPLVFRCQFIQCLRFQAKSMLAQHSRLNRILGGLMSARFFQKVGAEILLRAAVFAFVVPNLWFRNAYNGGIRLRMCMHQKLTHNHSDWRIILRMTCVGSKKVAASNNCPSVVLPPSPALQI